MRNVYDILQERGFIEQVTHEEELRELLGKESVTFYIGFDATADSLHVGHFVQLMVMAHMQRAGHRPIALIGGGTTMVGDPSGRTDMRQMLTPEQIEANGEVFKEQFAKLIDFSDDKAILANNADWLMNLEYIPFLREVGVHFSVNRMLTAEAFKSRMEQGLSFIEFNYMIMQAYDFLQLYRRENCKLQMGGNDQWSNIISGVDLVRRVESQTVYGMTFKLLTNSEGVKMGKTQSGAVWLDGDKFSPYEFYQYWRNVDDADVKNCLSLLTFLPMEEVNRLGDLEGSEINQAKEVLAFEVTKLVHGEEEAKKADTASKILFGNSTADGDLPSSELAQDELKEGLNFISLLQRTELISSRGEGRRLIQQGGVYINDERVSDIDFEVTMEDFVDNSLMIRKGKKIYHKVHLI